MNDVHFEKREGGRTFRASPLNAIFIDQHESWYAVHWTTPLGPNDVMNYCLKELGLSEQTCALVQSTTEGVMQSSLGDIQRQIEGEGTESIQLLRLDARDYIMVWEPSTEYEQFRRVGDAPYTAILGFGADKFDPDFGYRLFAQTATHEIGSMSAPIWQALGFLSENFAHGQIDSFRS